MSETDSEYAPVSPVSLDGSIPLGDDGTVLPDWAAARVLTLMRERQPALLSALIGEAYTGTAPAAQRRPREG
jgi:hypothetical protein